MLTYKLKLKQNINIDEYLKQYSKCFRSIFNNLELVEDKEFNKSLKSKFDLLDSWFIQCAKIEAKTKYEQIQTFNKKKLIQINNINNLIENKEYNNKKHLYKLKNKLSFLNRAINNNIVFGGKTLLQNITKLKQQNKIDEYLAKLKEFKSKRILPIVSIGETPQKSNRKFNFDLINNQLTFKPNNKAKIDLEFICSNKQQLILNQLQEMVGITPISVRLDNKFVYIIFDEQKLNNYEFKKLDYFKEIKNIKDKEIRKNIFKKYCREQEDRKVIGKIKDRFMAVDLNPEYIGLSIMDKKNNKLIYKEAIDLTKLNTKLRLSSKDSKQEKQNNKRKHEITVIWKYIFNLCKHYKVSNFVIEDLEFKEKNNKEFSKEFNRKTKNLWHRTLTINLINKYTNMHGINLIEINPAYSSFIGNLTYDYFDPISASIEIGRRGMCKYEKNNKQFGSIDSINLEKVKSYLLNENVQLDMSEMTIPKLFKVFSENNIKYRNVLVEEGIKENYLSSYKSKAKCYNFI